jgi:hypothetical protein
MPPASGTGAGGLAGVPAADGDIVGSPARALETRIPRNLFLVEAFSAQTVKWA